MTASELKYKVEQAGHEPFFFSRDTMKFFGDTMKNYGVCQGPTFQTHWDKTGNNYTKKPQRIVKTWELYRKKPVKHGLYNSVLFDQETFRKVFLESEE